MPRLSPAQQAFTTGEISPQAYGRVDIAKYFSAAEAIENFIVQALGGVSRRAGTRFKAAVKAEASVTRLLPFVFSPTTAYVIEAGAHYLRFYRAGGDRIEVGGVPVEVATPYAADDLAELDTRGSADIMYFFHPRVPTHRLERYEETVWRFRAAPFTPPPSIEFGSRPSGTLTPGATEGEGVPFTASAAAFLAADVGRDILVTRGTNGGARATITAVTDTTHATGTITQAFQSTDPVAAGSWKLTASPMAGLTPASEKPAGKTSVNLTLDKAGWRGGSSGFADADSDCGRFVIVNGGTYEIDAVTSSTVAAATIRGEASSTAKAESDTWSLEEALWSDEHGFPEAGSFFEGRLYTVTGFRLVGSKSNDYENFGVGVLDDDAVNFAIQSDQVNALRWVLGAKSLLLGSAGAEYVATGGSNDVITPSNIQIENGTTFGSSGVAPLRVGNVALFLTRSQRKLRELVFDFTEDNYKAPDLLLLAEHLTAEAIITDLAYQAEPNSTIWAVRDDGVALTCTYLRDQNVVAWARQLTPGAIESVCTVPHPLTGRDEVWWAVRRTINGATRRFVEVCDDHGGLYGAINTDASVLYEGAPTAVMTGLAHLENEEVVGVADGAVIPTTRVSGGQITLPAAAARIEVGLPYTSRLRTLRPEVTSGAGSSQPTKRRWVEILVRLDRTIGVRINGDRLPFRTTGDALGEAVPLFTGDKRIEHLGYDEGRITIEQDQPLPCTVLMVSGTLDLGGA